MRWGYVVTALPSVTLVNGSDPATLAAGFTAAIAAIVALGGQSITAVDLAGAGDGYSFTIRIEYAPSANVVPVLSGPAAAPPASLSGSVYMATGPEALAAQRAQTMPAVLTPPLGIVGVEVAGASQGARVCALELIGIAVIPPP